MNRRGIARATLLVTVLTVGSKLLGFVRDQLIALYFGASGQTDAYVVAMTLPTVLLGVVIGALATAFLPVFTERVVGEEGANSGAAQGSGESQGSGTGRDPWRLSDSIFTLTGLAAVAMAAGGVLAAPWLVRLMAPGFEAETFRLAVLATRVLFPAAVFTALAAPTKSVLNSFHHFGAPAAAPIAQNLVIFAALVGLVGFLRLGLMGLVLGLALGMAANLLVQVPYLRRYGFRFRLRVDWQDPGVRQVLALAWPVMLGALVGQVYLLVDRSLASGLAAGSIAALNFADKLRQLPLGIFAGAVATVVYPSLSGMAAEKNWAGLKESLGSGLRLVALVTVPAAFGLAVLREPLVRLLFERGAFDAADTATTAGALLFYAIGMVGLGANLVLVITFYSLRDTVTPVLISAAGAAANIALDYLLVGPMAHAGLALANSVAATTSTVLLLLMLRRKLGAMGYGRSAASLGKIGLASLAMSALLVALMRFWPPDPSAGARAQLFSVSLYIALAGAVYLAAVMALKVEEMQLLVGTLIRRVRRQSGGQP